MSIFRPVVFALFFVLASGAMASMISYETRATDNGVDRSDYMASWYRQSSDIHSLNLSSFNRIKAPGRYHHSRLHVSFELGSETSDWAFQLAPDAGFGGALYLNGSLIDIKASDLWWGKKWFKVSEILTGSNLSLTRGVNTIEAYWAERCCNGWQSARFSKNNGQDWLALSTENLDASPVAEPGLWLLFCSGLVAIVWQRRTRVCV